MNPNKSLFITFEGIEGCGKTTQIELIKQYLESKGNKLVVTREPGGTPIGDKLRDILLHGTEDHLERETELLLVIASRLEHVKKIIEPSLVKGNIVICDRFIDATVAYQGYARGLDHDLISKFNRFAIGTTLPDLTILLDIDEIIGLERAVKRSKELKYKTKDRFEQEHIEFHKRVRQGYQEIAKSDPARVKLVCADGSIEEVHQKIKNQVDKLICPPNL